MSFATLVAPLTFEQAACLLPLAHIIHFIEELPRFPGWAREQMGVPYTTAKFVVENAVLWLILTASVAGLFLWPGTVTTALVLSAPVGFVANVIFHAYPTLRTGTYSPGTVTACLFFAPLAVYVYWLAAVAGLLSTTVVVLSVILGITMLPLVVAVVHWVMDHAGDARARRRLLTMLVLPQAVLLLAGVVFGRDAVMKTMTYAGPVLLLPLLLAGVRRVVRPSGGE